MHPRDRRYERDATKRHKLLHAFYMEIEVSAGRRLGLGPIKSHTLEAHFRPPGNKRSRPALNTRADGISRQVSQLKYRAAGPSSPDLAHPKEPTTTTIAPTAYSLNLLFSTWLPRCFLSSRWPRPVSLGLDFVWEAILCCCQESQDADVEQCWPLAKSRSFLLRLT
jgi:hypothetical protein